ncbi:MAG: DNA-protecting protein DprA [Saprospiraceae bacterium]|nr:DNA-protecting protein DprA [Saprospiraceae bacterium]
MSELFYRIALTKVPKVGAVHSKNLIAHCGSAEAVFKSSKVSLMRINGIGEGIADYILTSDVLKWAEKELDFIVKNQVRVIYHTDPGYPRRLSNLADCPMLLYYKGTADLNAPRIVSIVGTRKPSPYGVRTCESIVEGFIPYNVLIVSGLAYGIDSFAHRKSLLSGIPTVGVMGTGLQRIYPTEHREWALKMIENGGLLTEYPSDQDPEQKHFPMRNRIIAGIADATIVIETAERGGSIITANMAFECNRDVFAVPGRVGDAQSKGCNNLLKKRKATLIESSEDLAHHLGWADLDAQKPAAQKQLFVELSDNEQIIVNFLKKSETSTPIDTLSLAVQMHPSQIASLLLSLEFKGIVQVLPGKRYGLV